MDRNLSCEEMDSDDLGGDLNLSDSEGGQEDFLVLGHEVEYHLGDKVCLASARHA